MKLGYSSNGLTEVSLDEALSTIASFGFQAVEILLDKPHWKDSRNHKTQVKSLKSRLNAHSLVLNNLNANDAKLLASDGVPDPRPLHAQAEVRQAVLDWHLHLLEIASELEAPLCFATGPTPRGVDEEEVHNQLTRHLETLVPRARQLGVSLSVEFEPDHYLDSWTALKPWCRTYEGLGVNFDIGHVACAGEDLIVSFKEALKFITNIHFEDIADKKHEHLVPGNGDLPLLEFLDALEESDYERGLTVELYNHAHRAEAALGETMNYFKTHKPLWVTR